MQSTWIWYPGDFEIYHGMICHSRRQVREARVPAFWRLSRPEVAATFEIKSDFDKPMPFKAITHGKGRVLLDNFLLGAVNYDLTVPTGPHTVTVNIYDTETFPSLYVASEGFESGKNWKIHCYDKIWKTPDNEPLMTSPDDNPAVFPFLYKKIKPIVEEELNGGTLYDFGTEQYGPITVRSTAKMGEVRISYGESREEALEWDECILHEALPAGNGKRKLESRAFRFIFVTCDNGKPVISAESEYLPLEDAASFSCDRPIVNSVWDICKRTVHLNAREFYMDGLKQDGWVWGGDSYQAYMAGSVLFRDPSVTKRSIRALYGRLPIRQHINTINDYTCYQIISVWEYYFGSGDTDFVRSVWEETKALYEFTVSRLEKETGYMIGREGDWIFIDWSTIDKTDPNSTEQILLWRVHQVMDELGRVMGDPIPAAKKRADRLKKNINRDFWRAGKSAFICTPATETEMVTRHANIMAILYDFATPAQRESIRENVLLNDDIVPITTPYFKFFELMALSKLGCIEKTQAYIESYWGKMAELGATTVWEQFDPNKTGLERYAMYGQKFGCSLCHVWGSGPIVLLCRYVAGVRTETVGGETFTVNPKPGLYQNFTAKVPMGNGTVTVSVTPDKVSAKADIAGGTLVYGGKKIVLEPGKKVSIKR